MSRRRALLAVCLVWGCRYDPSGVPADLGDAAPPMNDAADVAPGIHDGDAPSMPADAGTDAAVPDSPDAEPGECEEYDCHDPACAPCSGLDVCCDDGTCAGLGLCF